MTGPLYRPSRDEFLDLAAEHAVVPVWREVLADLQTPLAVYDRLCGAESGPTFLLESVEHGERWGRYSFTGLHPFCTVTARGGSVEVSGDLPAGIADQVARAAKGGDPLVTLDTLVAALRTPQLEGLPPLFAGAVGYIGYDTVRFVERIPDTGIDDLGLDDVRLVFPGQLIAFDHLRQRLVVVTNVLVGDDPAAQYDHAIATSEHLVARLDAPLRTPPVAPPIATAVRDADANQPREQFLKAVSRAKEYIRAGDIFQVVPSLRLSLDTDVDPLAVYRVLRVINPSPYMYLFDYGDLQVVGSSPEALVTVRGATATIQPIAGSRPRGDDPAEDAALGDSLLSDAKERAEHVMLVDLARNDLGRVCDLGTVRVSDFMQVVRYSHIMHLVSTVTGRVQAGRSAVDVVRATFPAGTLSGAPKVRAMEIIDELEPTRRSIYGGGIGYIDLAGNLDLCIAIRTVVFRGGRAYVQAGAGIVADSVPQREFEESMNKAMAPLAAVRAAEAMTYRG
ncbi:MAG TPA: anthranilate synthase component I [Egibacteraceae bacterium]|nr:anthranilate synthase component I [Egibacteraceae bacterium]